MPINLKIDDLIAEEARLGIDRMTMREFYELARERRNATLREMRADVRRRSKAKVDRLTELERARRALTKFDLEPDLIAFGDDSLLPGALIQVIEREVLELKEEIRLISSETGNLKDEW